MKKIKTVLLTLIFLAAISTAPFAAVVDKILVVVNNEVITQGEIDRILAPAYEQYKSMLPQDQLIKKLDDARQAVVAQLIDEKLVLSEAKKLKVEISEKDVNEKLREAKKRFPSDEMFEEALEVQHISIKDLKAKFREQLMTKMLIDQKVGSRIVITPKEVVKYYNEHTQDFSNLRRSS